MTRAKQLQRKVKEMNMYTVLMKPKVKRKVNIPQEYYCKITKIAGNFQENECVNLFNTVVWITLQSTALQCFFLRSATEMWMGSVGAPTTETAISLRMCV